MSQGKRVAFILIIQVRPGLTVVLVWITPMPRQNTGGAYLYDPIQLTIHTIREFSEFCQLRQYAGTPHSPCQTRCSTVSKVAHYPLSWLSGQPKKPS